MNTRDRRAKNPDLQGHSYRRASRTPEVGGQQAGQRDTYSALEVRVWVDSRDAKEIRRWAMEAHRTELADRFYRAEQQDDYRWRVPFVWRWRARHPVLLNCLYCDRWEGFNNHRAAKKHGWQRYHGEGWLHSECVDEWEKRGSNIRNARMKARERREAQEFLLGQPELLKPYKGVLVRAAPPQEHTFYGLLDDMEAAISADFGMERVQRVIDEMPADIRENLVAVGFTGYYHTYNLLLGWADAAPAQYRDAGFDDIFCRSVRLEEAPKRIRKQLPPHISAKL